MAFFLFEPSLQAQISRNAEDFVQKKDTKEDGEGFNLRCVRGIKRFLLTNASKLPWVARYSNEWLQYFFYIQSAQSLLTIKKGRHHNISLSIISFGWRNFHKDENEAEKVEEKKKNSL